MSTDDTLHVTENNRVATIPGKSPKVRKFIACPLKIVPFELFLNPTQEIKMDYWSG